MVQKDNGQINPQENEAIFEYLRAMVGRDEALIRQHAKAGLSMYGADSRYSGEFVELSPEGQYFVVKRQGNSWVRVREVSA